jgi:hypothetical protein
LACRPERRHLSEQAFDTYHVFLYGVPLGTLKTGFRLLPIPMYIGIGTGF